MKTAYNFYKNSFGGFCMRGMRFVKFSLILAVMLLSCTAALAGGQVDKVDGLYVITLEGSPYDMGFQQGSLLKDDIRLVYKNYLYKKVIKEWTKQYAYLAGKGGPKAHSDPRSVLLDEAQKHAKNIPDEFLEEMRGLADGAGLKYEDVLILSSHIDYFAVLCSTFVARGAVTADGAMIEGRNLDWAKGGLTELDPLSAVIVRKPENGHAWASVIYPGLIGDLTILNDAGMAIELNFSMAVKEENGETGMPALVIMRKLAQYAGSIEEAEAILKETPRIAGYNITVADGKTNEAEVIEVTAKTMGIVPLVDDTVVTTNHFTSAELDGKNVAASNFSSSPSPERYARLKELLQENKGRIDPEVAKTMMHDAGVMVPGTVQTVVLRPETRDFWVWSRNRAAGDFVHLNLNDLLAQGSEKAQN